ncbi:MAG: DUF309 domain-containing protein [Fuerstiella sp.]|nr:DUF309 domain-containing protein [Fuerstiella sp.]
MIAHGMFLFNLGSYWEAHEAWEHLWMALGRSGSEADIVKGLIKLAACGVKCLQANPVGASRHSSVQVLTRAFDIEAGHCPNSEPERSKHVWLPRLEIKTARRDDLWQALPENSYA